MHKALIATALALVFTSCGSTEPGPVRVIGVPEELAPLTGEWTGIYESRVTGRSGSIVFHLTENPAGAHGDVLMVGRQQIVREREGYASQYPSTQQGMASSASVLSIAFVRIGGGKITGKIASYPDPEDAEATLETRFEGRVDGDRIEGTFVTYSDRGVSARRGTWRVERKRPA
jgi:hypothetical protein